MFRCIGWGGKTTTFDGVHGVDIKNTMHSYKPDDVSINSNVTSDYNAVKGIWMESYSGAIFEAGYGAGSYNDSGSAGGRLMQNGCRYLVDKKGKSYMAVCIIIIITALRLQTEQFVFLMTTKMI